jgi:AAA domain
VSRGAWAVARLLQGVPATSVDLDQVDQDWRELAAAIAEAPDRGAALERALASRPDGKQRWAELLAADALDAGEPPKTTRLLTVEELEQLPPPRWLVRNHLVAESISVLFGPSGGGKTFVALDLALAVATGQDWLGTEPVEGGYVVYATGEGLAGLARRIAAWREAHGSPSLARFRVLPVAVQFMDAADLERLRADLRTLPEAPKLIVVDTLARSMVGAEENSARDMGVFLAGIERISTEWAAHVLLVHHTGKTGETERGTTALRAFVQTMLRLVGEDGTATLSCDKQKDGAAPFVPTALRLVPTADGATCTVQLAARAGEPTLTTRARAVLAALDANFLEEGATATEWMTVCAVPDSTFYGARKQLLVGEYVGKVGRRYVVLDKGHVALEEQRVSGLTPTPKELQANSTGAGSHASSKTPHTLKGVEFGSGETETCETSPAEDGQAPLLKREELALATLDERFGARGATDAEWRDACIDSGQARASYYRAKPVLLARGLVVVEGTGPGARHWLAHEGASGGLGRPESHEVSPGRGLSPGETNNSSETSSGETSAGTGFDGDEEGQLPWR